MRRIISVWLPAWSTDRLRRNRPDVASPADALVMCRHDGRRLAVAAVDAAARALGILPGMPLTQARMLVPGLAVADADPAGDQAALDDLAAWCLRYAPMTAADAPDGIWIDTTGCAHLFEGEAALLTDLTGRLADAGITARAAIADTPGAAWAMARFGTDRRAVVPPGAQAAALALLPLAALRIAPDILRGLRRLGVERIGSLMAMPRGPLARRFGAGVLTRLDQALGRVPEPIAPVCPPGMIQERRAFIEPLISAEAFAAVIEALVHAVCVRLTEAGQGARRLDLTVERVDGSTQTIAIGTARPVRDACRLVRLLRERIEQIDPGEGVEAMRLAVARSDALSGAQLAALAGDDVPDLGMLVDVLANRFGPARVYRCAPVESDVPERSVRRISALAPPSGTNWPTGLPRPIRLLHPPQRVEAMSLLPDQPPVAFTWRRLRRRIHRADGPERITGEWWRHDAETAAVRDYWAVEDEAGRRYWLFRRGDGTDPATGDLSWFLHGFF